MKRLIGIVARDNNWAIGQKGGLPWQKISADMKRFRDLTIGHTVVMGQVTADTLPEKYRPLPNRRNIVLSLDPAYSQEGFEKAGSPEELWPMLSDEEKVFVIGGATIYQLLLPYIDVFYVSHIAGTNRRADTYLPTNFLREDEFTFEREGSTDPTVTFYVYTRKKQVVDTNNPGAGEYAGVIGNIADKGKCPFCPDNFIYHKQPILMETEHWLLTTNSWPYRNTRHHFLFISKVHKETLAEMIAQDWIEIDSLLKWMQANYDVPGGALAMRFGNTRYTGASVCHLHGSFIVPDIGNENGQNVKRPVEDTEFDQHPDAAWFRIG